MKRLLTISLTIKKMLLLATLLMAMQTTYATSLSVHFPDITLHSGGTREMVVSYDTDKEDLGGFQIEFVLPDGISLVDAQPSKALRQVCPHLEVHFNKREFDGTTVVASANFNMESFPIGRNDFLVLAFKADNDVPQQTYEITTTHIELPDWVGNINLLDNQTFHITVTDAPKPEPRTLVLWHVDGTTTDVALSNMPKVEFTKDKVRITSFILDMEYPRTDIIRFTYKGGEDIQVGIDQASQAPDFIREGDRLIFHGVRSADKVTIYTIDGKRVPARLTESAEGVTLSLSSITRGVYILNVNGKTSKFTRP